MLAKQQFQETSKRLNPVHGNIYQLKLLMLFLYRGVSNQYSFRLATEVKEAEKFDDLVFQYVEDGKIKYRLLQAKHKLDESKKITLDDLLGRNDNNYSLVKYFFSYRNAKKSKLFQDGIIEDVIICTNIGLDLPDLKRNGIEVKNIEGLDYILDIKNSASKRYGFNQGLISKLKPILDKNLKHGNLISDEEIQDFLNHLVFAVNQPNEEKLGKIIKNEIGEDLDLVTTENTYNKFFITMLRWLQGKERERFLSYEEGKEFFEQAKRGLPILFNVRDSVSSFAGRIEQLDNLHKAMMNGGRTIVSQSVSISGLGGVGKSELARKYISQYSKDYDNKVIWINAESYSTLSESFRRLACDKLGISLKNRDGKEKDIKSIVEDVYRFFSKGKSLFVFDNAEKYRSQREDDDGIDKFLPSLPENMNKPHILVTSRNKKWPQNVKLLELNVFTQKEAIEFIKKALGIENNEQEEDVINLAETLQHFPLALQQAVAYIREKKKELRNVGLEFTINDYLQRYEGKTRELLNFPFPEDSDDNYTKATFTALKVQLDAIEKRENGNKAIEIINAIAYLAPENISTKMFLGLQSNKEELGSAIELLKQYSIVNVEQEQAVLSVHRLVQQVTRLNLDEQGRAKETIGRAFNLLEKNFPDGSDRSEDSAKKRELLPHCEALLSYLDDWLVKKTEDKQKVEDYFEQLTELIRDGYNDLGNHKRQKELLERALPILEKRYGSDHVVVARTLVNLGISYGNLGDYHKKKELLERALVSSREKCYSSNNFQVAGALVDLGNTYMALGDNNKAKELLEQALPVIEKHYGSYHIKLAKTLVNLGNAYGSLGNPKKQKELLERALDIKEKHYGSDHFEVAIVLVNLGTAYGSLGNPKKQKELLERALNIQEKHYGSNHFYLAGTLVNLGISYGDLGDYHKKKELLEKALPILKKHYGSSHVEVAKVLGNLGGVYGALGDHNKAKELLERALHIQEKHYGSDHFEVARVLLNLGTTYGALGDTYKKKELLERALDIQERYYGRDHFELAMTLGNLGNAYGALGDNNKAKELLERALDINEKHYGSNHVEVARILWNLGIICGNLGDYNKKKELLERVLPTLESNYGRDHFRVAMTLENLGDAYGNLGDHKKQKGFLERALPILEKHYGRDHFKVAITLVNLGSSYRALGNSKTQKELLERALPVLENNNHPVVSQVKATLNTLSNHNRSLAPLLQAVQDGNLEEVKSLVKNVSDINAKDTNGATPLYHAAYSGHVNIVDFLLKKGADIAKATNNGTTPLHISVFKGKNEVIEVLLRYAKQLNPIKSNGFVNAKTANTGKTALHVAAEKGNLHVVKFLLENGAVYNAKNEDNKTPLELTTDDRIKDLFNLVEGLFENVKIGNNQQVVQCLKKEKAIVNARDNNGGTPLYWTISKGDLDTANILLDNDADPTLVTNKGNTPLHMASNKEKTKAVKVLLTHVRNKYSDKLGQFINAQTTVGETSALHIASDIEVTRSLLQYGSVYNIKNKEGKTPLDLAKNDDIRKLLSFTNELFEGVKNGNRQVISKLRNLEVDDFVAVTNARNDQGHTLLQVAIANKHRDIATELSKMLKNLAPSSSMESVNVAGPSRSHENLPS